MTTRVATVGVVATTHHVGRGDGPIQMHVGQFVGRLRKINGTVHQCIHVLLRATEKPQVRVVVRRGNFNGRVDNGGQHKFHVGLATEQQHFTKQNVLQKNGSVRVCNRNRMTGKRSRLWGQRYIPKPCRWGSNGGCIGMQQRGCNCGSGCSPSPNVTGEVDGQKKVEPY